MTRFYDTANWKKIAKAQLAREPMCQGCSVNPAAAVDHIIPITRGGAKRDAANLQSICRDCHQEKTNMERVGKRWVAPKYKGCFLDGTPRDPSHPFYTGGPEIAGSSRSTPGWEDTKRVSFPDRKK